MKCSCYTFLKNFFFDYSNCSFSYFLQIWKTTFDLFFYDERVILFNIWFSQDDKTHPANGFWLLYGGKNIQFCIFHTVHCLQLPVRYKLCNNKEIYEIYQWNWLCCSENYAHNWLNRFANILCISWAFFSYLEYTPNTNCLFHLLNIFVKWP